jgi:hypothetical protein
MDDSFEFGPNVGPRQTIRYDGAHTENAAETTG